MQRLKGDEHGSQFGTIMINNQSESNSNHSNNDNKIGLIQDNSEILTPAMSDRMILKVECSIG